MFGFFLTLLVLDGIFLATIILLQSGKGGGLAAMGGGVTSTEGVLGGRQAATFLVRASWAAGAAFMILSLILAILSSRAQAPGSILEEGLQQAPTQPTPVIPNEGAVPPGQGGAPPEQGGAPPDDAGLPPGEGALPPDGGAASPQGAGGEEEGAIPDTP